MSLLRVSSALWQQPLILGNTSNSARSTVTLGVGLGLAAANSCLVLLAQLYHHLRCCWTGLPIWSCWVEGAQ
jgi:hypothetical protein